MIHTETRSGTHLIALKFLNTGDYPNNYYYLMRHLTRLHGRVKTLYNEQSGIIPTLSCRVRERKTYPSHGLPLRRKARRLPNTDSPLPTNEVIYPCYAILFRIPVSYHVFLHRRHYIPQHALYPSSKATIRHKKKNLELTLDI